jgi:carbonic anhydrase
MLVEQGAWDWGLCLNLQSSILNPHLFLTTGDASMKKLAHLFENNRQWVRAIEAENPGFFTTLTGQQNPEYLWIGCSDSRVPANEIVGLLPGELFVHRNVGNLVIHSDMNCLSVIQYAVDVLKIKHIIVCGHYGCGGVRAALEPQTHGLVDNWLRHIQDIRRNRQDQLCTCKTHEYLVDRLCELNVVQQVHNVCSTTIVLDAWSRGQPLCVHGWIYGVADGRLRDLNICTASQEDYLKLDASKSITIL